MIKLLSPLLLTVALAPNALPNDSLDPKHPCMEIYGVLMEGVAEGYLQKEAADEMLVRCITKT